MTTALLARGRAQRPPSAGRALLDSARQVLGAGRARPWHRRRGLVLGGTFVCNHTFFVLMDAAPKGVRAGFVHVPWSTEHAPQGAPSLALASIAEAIEVVVRTTLTTAVDERVPGGALH